MNEQEVPPPPPDVDTSPPWVSDRAATDEEVNWDNESELRGQKTKNDLIWLKVYGGVLVSMTVFFAALFGISLAFWAWHYLAPSNWGWLGDDQLSKIQSIIFSGSLGAIVSTIVGRQITKTR